MTKRPDGRGWRNPAFVANDGASRIAGSLGLGRALRRKAADGFALGTFVIECPVPATLRALAFAGFDFAVIDMEHSAIDFSNLDSLIAAGHAAGLPILVRPWGEDSGLIGKALDLGANGIEALRGDSGTNRDQIPDGHGEASEGRLGQADIIGADEIVVVRNQQRRQQKFRTGPQLDPAEAAKDVGPQGAGMA